MMMSVEYALGQLSERKKLDTDLIVWGLGAQTKRIINWLNQNGYSGNLCCIISRFRCTYYHECENVPVVGVEYLKTIDKQSVSVIFSCAFSDAVYKQLEAYGFTKIYDLSDLDKTHVLKTCEIPYHFTNRSKGKRYLCYILAGYESVIWDSTLARIEAYQWDEVDYCLVSSGKYDDVLDKLAERNHWSYLYTEQNQVCYAQNLAIDLHPFAEYIFKLDEDIFVGPGFFERMMNEYLRIEAHGEYRIGYATPVIPLNCCGYVSYLKRIGKLEEFEKRFGRAYRSRYSAIYLDETAEFLWETIDTFDAMAERFRSNTGAKILHCYYNIGCILFSRDRWLMMGKWIEQPGENGMGGDEKQIDKDNWERDMPVYEIQSVLAGHLAFGSQKKRMLEYYKKYPEKFRIG